MNSHLSVGPAGDRTTASGIDPLLSLRWYPQWVVWRLEPRPGATKPAKLPYDPKTGKRADTTNPATWSDHQTAVAALRSGQYQGIGFVLSETDPFFFLDLDGCRDHETANLTEEAQAICAMFRDAAWEVSQSGEGLHILGRCDPVQMANRRNKWNGWLEFYTKQRFIAFGSKEGEGWQGNADLNWTPVLQMIVPVRTDQDIVDVEGRIIASGRDPRWKGPEDDDELLKRILASTGGTKAKLGKSPTNRQLWEGDAKALGEFFPDASNSGKQFDHSAADQSLMNCLAYWTGRDHETMIRLFSRSALGRRDKWRNRAYIRNRTTANSINACREVYCATTPEERRQLQRKENQEIGDIFNNEKVHADNLSVDEMYDRFFFLYGSEGIVDRTNFQTYKISAADRLFAGSVTVVPVGEPDPITAVQKTTKLSNFKLWMTEADGRTKQSTATLTWRPGSPVIIDIPEGHDKGFNMWRGFRFDAPPPDWQQWLEPWRVHLEYLVPDPSERHRFEQWLAHMVQRPDVLPHTAYLMFTETKGIGRNWLSGVLARVLKGYVALGIDAGQILDGGFNGRLSQKLLAVVDEIRAGMEDRRYTRAERLKAVVTQEAREINVKHGLQSVEWNCMRWLFFSNHPDALPFDNDDRRIEVIANPIERQSEQYYSWLYEMIGQPPFIASVFRHLQTLDLTGFNPGRHATMNAAKRQSIDAQTSEVDRAAQMFAREWPGTLATNRHLQDFIRKFTCDDRPLRNLHHVAKRAGMRSAPKPFKIHGQAERILILRNFTPEQISSFSGAAVEKIVNDADAQFQLGGYRR